jgi:DNA-binding NarL/FixJ family response regulator
MFMIRRAQGRLEEMRPVLRLLARSGSTSGIWRPGLVLAYAELGMLDEAQAAYDELLADGLASLPRDALWPLSLMFLADASVLLDRTDAAPLLVDELEHLGGLTIRAGYTTNGGPADRCRAAMAELAGRHELAERCIADAADLAVASGSPLWLALTEATWASILARRGDGRGAAEHHRTAAQLAAQFHIACIPTNVVAPPMASEASTDGLPDGLSAREVEVLVELANGCTNREIADRLFISPNTAANHVRAILQKTGSANRTEAAAYAFRHDLVPAPNRSGP